MAHKGTDVVGQLGGVDNSPLFQFDHRKTSNVFLVITRNQNVNPLPATMEAILDCYASSVRDRLFP